MRTIEIVGDNFFGKWDKTRTACRAIVLKDKQILLSYETVTGQWMLPGGGLEEGESEKSCCQREVAEETGHLIDPSSCLFEIDEYYEDYRYINRYFAGESIGKAEIRLTEREREVGMEPRWLPLSQITDIFSRHAAYTNIDEMRRGMYLREYTALEEFTRLRDINRLTLRDLQPSQFYISEKKLADVRKWFDPDDLSRFEAIPVKVLDGLPVMTDGHTRAVAAILAGCERLPLIWDEDDLDWDMYRRCVEECTALNILAPQDLVQRIVSEKDYDVKWNQWCDAMQTEVREKRNTRDSL